MTEFQQMPSSRICLADRDIALGTWDGGHADTRPSPYIPAVQYARSTAARHVVMWVGHADTQTNIGLLMYRFHHFHSYHVRDPYFIRT